MNRDLNSIGSEYLDAVNERLIEVTAASEGMEKILDDLDKEKVHLIALKKHMEELPGLVDLKRFKLPFEKPLPYAISKLILPETR
jgi:hypothetical protein